MIKNLTLQNIKCFASAEFSFAPLTLFCGENSVGKSTAVQCLLLLRQSHKSKLLSQNEIQLVGDMFSVGHVRDLFCQFPTSSDLVIKLDDLEFKSDMRKIDREAYVLPISRPEDISSSLFSGNVIYLCAERMGPRSSYDISFNTSGIDLGIYGQFAMSVFSRMAFYPALNQKLARFALDAPEPKEGAPSEIALEICVKTVMRKIFGEFDVKTQIHDTMDRVSNTFSTDGAVSHVRPANTGFGISSTFPIIVGAFCLNPGDTLIVENPEVHLHPHAQSELAKFLGLAARTGAQIIVETHSDHVLNGFRLSSKINKTPSDEVIINSITRAGDKRNIKIIQIDSDGNLSDLDEGFFDQIQKDLFELF